MRNLSVWEVTLCGSWYRFDTSPHERDYFLPKVKRTFTQAGVTIYKLTSRFDADGAKISYRLNYPLGGRLELKVDVYALSEGNAFSAAKDKIEVLLEETNMCGIPDIEWDRHE